MLDALAVLVALVIIIVPARAVLTARTQGQTAAQQGFADQDGLSAGFTAFYVGTILRHEQQLAVNLASDSGFDPAAILSAVMTADGFRDGVVLSPTGAVLTSAPSDAVSAGDYVAARAVNVAAASGGDANVSGVSPSAVNGTPEVAFTVPVRHLGRTYVLSAAYELSATELSTFLNGAFTVHRHVAFLVDRSQQVVARSPGVGSGTGGNVDTLTAFDPSLAAAAVSASTGTYAGPHGQWTFARAPVAGTPWSLLLAEPTSAVYASVQNTALDGTWVLLAGYALLVLVALGFFFRFLNDRDRLRALSFNLDELSRTDPLTGVDNRRQIDERLRTSSRSSPGPLSILMIDIDFFKRVNDAYGHQVGDAVLRSVTERIRVLLRAGDVVGRWGGEEFLVLLADADRDGAAEVAERIRMSIAQSPLDAGNGYGVPVTVSIGVAVDRAPGVSELNELVGAADAALYRAKAEGRNRVVAA